MRIGILGASRIAVAAIIEPAPDVGGVEVAGVAASQPARAAAYAAEHGLPRAYDSYAAMLRDPAIDAVYVALANSAHARWAAAALEAGKHVLCEKPLARNADEAAALVATADARGRLLVEAFHWRYHPVAERMIELARAIGPLRELSAWFSAAISPDDPLRYDYALGGGAMMDLGCYCVHMLRATAGGEPTVLGARAVEGPPRVDVTMDADLLFGDDVHAALHCTMDGFTRWPDSMVVRARGDGGSLEVLNPMAPQHGHRITARLARTGEHLDEVVDAPTSYACQLDAFRRAVAGEVTPLTGGADAVATLRVIDAVYTASGLGPRGG